MMNKKGSTLWMVVLAMIVFLGLSFSLYNWAMESAKNTGKSIDPQFTEFYNNMTTLDDPINSKVEEMRVSAANIAEADSSFAVAWNGLKGLGSLFTLPLAFIDSAVNIWEVSMQNLKGKIDIPDYVFTLITIAIITFIFIRWHLLSQNHLPALLHHLSAELIPLESLRPKRHLGS